jgi:hypothetical protein
VQKDYLMLGALILLFSFLQGAFSESPYRTFLLGLVLTAIFIMFYITLSRILFNNKSSSLVGIIYTLFNLFFFFVFMLLCFKEYGTSFAFSTGILFAFLFLIVTRDIRNLGILLVIRKIENGFKRVIAYVLLFLAIFIVLSIYSTYILNYEVNYPSPEKLQNLSSLNNMEIFTLTSLSFSSFFLIIFFIIMVAELSYSGFRRYYSKMNSYKILIIYRISLRLIKNIKGRFNLLIK